MIIINDILMVHFCQPCIRGRSCIIFMMISKIKIANVITYIETMTMINFHLFKPLKRQSHKISTIFLFKASTSARYEQEKTVSWIFSFSQKFENRCLRSQRLHWHAITFLDTEIFIFWNYFYWMCKCTQITFFAWLFL